MWRSVASNAITFLIIGFLALGIAGIWGKTQYAAPGPLVEPICVRVAPGATFRAVVDDLNDQGALISASLMRIGAEYEGKTSKLKAGSFLVPETSSMRDIADILTRGGANTCGTEVVYRIGIASTSVELREMDPSTQRSEEKLRFALTETAPDEFTKVANRSDTRHRITMAEGVTSWQVVETLRSISILSGDIGEIPPEGLLAPYSYELSADEKRSDVLDRMISKQAMYLDQAWENRADGLPIKSKQEALILASIIEKETAVSDERGLVASVFANRLNQGIPLQTDPTVIYGLTKGQGILGRGLRQSELKKDTPWNTYVHLGLPPTPIANPGRAAIEAAVNPAKTDYIFFVADGTGGHAFAKTLKEHNANVAKWRKIEAGQNNN
jgi:UPF0755 protein